MAERKQTPGTFHGSWHDTVHGRNPKQPAGMYKKPFNKCGDRRMSPSTGRDSPDSPFGIIQYPSSVDFDVFWPWQSESCRTRYETCTQWINDRPVFKVSKTLEFYLFVPFAPNDSLRRGISVTGTLIQHVCFIAQMCLMFVSSFDLWPHRFISNHCSILWLSSTVASWCDENVGGILPIFGMVSTKQGRVFSNGLSISTG